MAVSKSAGQVRTEMDLNSSCHRRRKIYSKKISITNSVFLISRVFSFPPLYSPPVPPSGLVMSPQQRWQQRQSCAGLQLSWDIACLPPQWAGRGVHGAREKGTFYPPGTYVHFKCICLTSEKKWNKVDRILSCAIVASNSSMCIQWRCVRNLDNFPFRQLDLHKEKIF